MAFYDVSSTSPNIFHLNLRICRLRENPPPSFIRMKYEGSNWSSLDAIPDEFLFIVKEIGKRINDSNAYEADHCYTAGTGISL